ncbi:MAG: YdcF family protein [Halioglobus sp.]|nr:YdcF family protein [Halioglobus sp.]
MLLYPLSQALLLCLAGLLLLLLRRERAAFVAGLLGVGWLYLCSTALVADLLMAQLERAYPPRALALTPSADAIVLLGGGVRGATHGDALADLNPQADRLVYATALYQAGRAPVILATGGNRPGARPEAEMTRDILRVMGVPDAAILLETRSRDTHDNAVYSAALLRARDMRRVLLVTSAFHMRRAQALFEAQGLEVIPAPTDYQRLAVPPAVPPWLPGVENLARSTHALHELLGYRVYRCRGWL